MAGGSGSNLGAPGMPGGSSSMGDPLGLFNRSPGYISPQQRNRNQWAMQSGQHQGFGDTGGARGLAPQADGGLEGAAFGVANQMQPNAGAGFSAPASMQSGGYGPLAQSMQGMLGNTPGMNAPAPQLGPMQSWMGMQIPGPAPQTPQWANGPATQGGQYLGMPTPQPQFSPMQGGPARFQGPPARGPAVQMQQQQGGGYGGMQQRGGARAGLLNMLGEPGG